jgi:hypothetical protein
VKQFPCPATTQPLFIAGEDVAVGLRYVRGETPVPRVVCKGRGIRMRRRQRRREAVAKDIGGAIFHCSRTGGLPAIDRIFPAVSCANYAQAMTTDLKRFAGMVLLQRAGSSRDSATADLVTAFPQTSGHLPDCAAASFTG